MIMIMSEFAIIMQEGVTSAFPRMDDDDDDDDDDDE